MSFAALRQLTRVAAVARPAVRASRGMATEAAPEKISLTFAAPHNAFFADAEVEQVNVPSTSGDFGIMPNHVPALACLKPGVVSVFEGGNESKIFVSSGTVTVNADSSVQIIAEEAALLEDLDIAAARKGLEAANAQASSANEDDKAAGEVAQDVFGAMIKALE